MDAEILSKVIEMAAEQAGVDPNQVSPESHFENDLNYDSLDRVEFAMAVEDAFGITVSDEEAEKLRYVREVVEYIEAHGQSKPGQSKAAETSKD